MHLLQALLEGSEAERDITGPEFEDWIKNGYGAAPTDSPEAKAASRPGNGEFSPQCDENLTPGLRADDVCCQKTIAYCPKLCKMTAGSGD